MLSRLQSTSERNVGAMQVDTITLQYSHIGLHYMCLYKSFSLSNSRRFLVLEDVTGLTSVIPASRFIQTTACRGSDVTCGATSGAMCATAASERRPTWIGVTSENNGLRLFSGTC